MKRLLAALCCLLLCVLTGCGAQQPVSPPETDAPAPEADIPAPEADASPEEVSTPEEVPAPQPLPAEPDAVDALLASLTLEEQVGQLFFVRCPAENAAEDVQTYHLGGYLLFGRDTQDKTADDLVQTIRRYQDAAAADTGIPLLIGVDEEGGTVVRVSSNPNLRQSRFPSPQTLFSKGGMEAVTEDTREKDALLHALGFNVNFAPVADVSTNRQDFIYPRTFGQSAGDTAQYTAAVTAQMDADGMGSVLKHFPGYGNNADTHTGIAVDQQPFAQFVESDFLPFSAAFTPTTAVLVSHNIVTCMDATLPASLSPAVHDVLRLRLGFSGCIMTDDLAMDAVSAYARDGSVAVLSLLAGNDIVLTSDYRTQIPQVLAAIADGTLDEAVIHRACRNVLQWKQQLGLLP